MGLLLADGVDKLFRGSAGAFIHVTASRLHANHIRLFDQGSGLAYLRHEDWFVVEHGDTSAGAGGFIGGFQYASRLRDVFP